MTAVSKRELQHTRDFAEGASKDIGNPLIAVVAFTTLVDLFATQAIVPTLAQHYGVSPGTMGIAINACTIGMAAASLSVALISNRIERHLGIVLSLCALALPTLLLAHAQSLAAFAALRICQGLCMATAFALSLALLGERFDARRAAAASAAYITGNVASNLIGRLLSATIADHVGLGWSFYAFAGLNLVGAVVAFVAFRSTSDRQMPTAAPAPIQIQTVNRWPVIAACGIGFLILFGFIGTFTYVNFVLMEAPIALGQMQVGFVYFVFLPSIFTTPLAGPLVRIVGTRNGIILGLSLAVVGLPALLSTSLIGVMFGLCVVAVGTFLAQAIATGYVSRTMSFDRGTASGLYLASYFLGGLCGAALLGSLFEAFGWMACVFGVGAAFLIAIALAFRLE